MRQLKRWECSRVNEEHQTRPTSANVMLQIPYRTSNLKLELRTKLYHMCFQKKHFDQN